jgi:RecA/RadA recombinase
MNATVHTISPHVMSVDAPTWLKHKPYWLTWAYESDARDPEGTKPRKVPYYTNGQRRNGTQGGASDMAQLTTFEAARAAARRRGFDGVGLALSVGAGIVACDFDNCINVDGHVGIHPAVREVVLGTYAEYSPSGQGVRAFFRGAALGNFKDAHGKPFGFEIFSDKGFVTFTGNATEDTDMLGCLDHVELVSPELKALCDARFGVGRERAGVSTGDALMDYRPAVGVSLDETRALLAQLNPDMSRDKWLQVGMAVHHETSGSLEGFTVWDEWSRGGAKYGLGQPIERVWESFKRDGTSGGAVVTMATVKKLVAQSVGEAALDQPSVATDTTRIPYQVIPADEFAQRPIPAWLMYGVLPRQHVGMVYGASGSGKSFIVLDMCMAHARGTQWRDLSTSQCGVVYVAAEGAGGFVKRVKAYAQHHNIDMAGIAPWFGVIDGAPDFMDVEEVRRVKAAIDARVQTSGIPVGLIVLDTLSRVTPDADEQSKEMGVALDLATRLAKSTGALVLIIHHSGKNAALGARGWSGMKAAMDVELEVARVDDAGLVRCLTVSKNKDGEDGAQFFFALEGVELGVDSDLNAITSAVCKEVALPTPEAMGQKALSGLRLKVFNHLWGLGQTVGIEPEAVILEIVAGMPKVEGKRDTRKQVAKRALNELCDEGYFKVVDGCIDLIIEEKEGAGDL